MGEEGGAGGRGGVAVLCMVLFSKGRVIYMSARRIIRCERRRDSVFFSVRCRPLGLLLLRFVDEVMKLLEQREQTNERNERTNDEKRERVGGGGEVNEYRVDKGTRDPVR